MKLISVECHNYMIFIVNISFLFYAKLELIENFDNKITLLQNNRLYLHYI